MAISHHAFIYGFFGALGVAIVIAIAMGIARLVDFLSNKYEVKRNSAKRILKDKKEYIKNQFYEELVYIEKYQDQLKRNEWPDEMNEKFELVDCQTVAATDEEGSLYTYKKQLLRLKDKFRVKKIAQDSSKDDKKDDKK